LRRTLEAVIAVLAAAALLLPPVGGAFNYHVTRNTLDQTVCVSGYSSRIRPPTSYTEPIKRRLLITEHLAGSVRDYQLDHLVSLSIGGAPRSRANLWMQPIQQADRDDTLEGRWHRALCDGTMTLKQARRTEIRWKRLHG
jgi:hypothetical protein